MSGTKKEILERMALKFTKIKSQEVKDYAILCMAAYQTGKETGRKEERERMERQETGQERSQGAAV